MFFSLAHSLRSFEVTEGDEVECFFAGMGKKLIPANPLKPTPHEKPWVNR